jgi:uncharacterized membrane protein
MFLQSWAPEFLDIWNRTYSDLSCGESVSHNLKVQHLALVLAGELEEARRAHARSSLFVRRLRSFLERYC